MKKTKLKILLHLAICLGIAWMITNGWAYICMALGFLFDWNWAKTIGGAYLAFLWLPITP